MPPKGGSASSALLDRISIEIARGGPISFARFMELALYAPHQGYYARGAERLGRQGDFFTASDSGRGFGRCIANQIREIDREIGPLDPFHVVEFGSGRGLLARDVLDSVATFDGDLARRLRYSMVDRSAAMRAVSEQNAPGARAIAPEELGGGYQGCLLAVELFDALPVHRVRRRERLREIRVTVDETGRLAEVEAEPEPEVEALALRYGAAAEEGTEAEVCPALPAQFATMQAALSKGVLIVVDYGYLAAELYDPTRRAGTLLAYHKHATNQQFLERVGRQDLTAHVNFTALLDAAAEQGLDALTLTTQDRFLVANGILEQFEQRDRSQVHDPRRVKERMQAMQLIHPLGMGRTFKVLLLSKGLRPAPTLSGATDPFSTR